MDYLSVNRRTDTTVLSVTEDKLNGFISYSQKSCVWCSGERCQVILWLNSGEQSKKTKNPVLAKIYIFFFCLLHNLSLRKKPILQKQ